MSIIITIDDNLNRAISERYAGAGLSAEAVAKLGLQFMANAPQPVVTYVKGIKGGIGDMWGDFATHVRNEQKRALGAELALAEAVRGVCGRA